MKEETRNSLVILSIIASLLGIFFLPFIGGGIGVVLGVVAKPSHNRWAILGICLGVASLLLSMISFCLTVTVWGAMAFPESSCPIMEKILQWLIHLLVSS